MFYNETKTIELVEEEPSLVFELIKEGHIEFVDMLLKKKIVDINTCDDAGNNILVRLLKCGYLDILLLHRPDALVDYQEVNEAFTYLYEKGLVKKFGVSNMNPWQIELYRKFVNFEIAYNQVQFSLVHSQMISQGLFVNMRDNEAVDRSSGLLEYCQLNNIEVQAWSALMASWAEGSFIDHPNYPKLNEKLAELANKYNVTKNAIAIAWILRHPSNIVPIVGTTSIAHLLELVKAREITLTRSEWYALYLAAGHYLP